MTVGFVGIGTMGLPMAGRLLAAGVPMMVWNRTPEKCKPLIARGAIPSSSIDELFRQCSLVLVMLLDQGAVDAVLGRGTPAFAKRVRDRTVVMLGTTSAAYSAGLDSDIRNCGGRYVEAPVSGSRIPAEEGALVGMISGDADEVRRVESLLSPLCRTIVRCGAIPASLRTKLAINHYLIVLVMALAETVATADASGVDLDLFQQVLDAGPMASTVSRTKLRKLMSHDFAAEAAIGDVAKIAALVRDQARGAQVDAPLIESAALLFEAARVRGLSDLDMVAVLQPAPSTSELQVP